MRPFSLAPAGAILAGLLLFAPPSAVGHGAAQWIADAGLRDPASGEWCCGVSDCEPIDERQLTPVQGGYRYAPTGETFEQFRLLPSQDGRWWRCHRPDGSARCWIGISPGS